MFRIFYIKYYKEKNLVFFFAIKSKLRSRLFRKIKIQNKMWRIKWRRKAPSSGQVASRFTITAILGDAPRSMMDWKYSIISGASLQCLSRIFSWAESRYSPKSYDISICQGGRKMELRLKREHTNVDWASLSPAEDRRVSPKAAERRTRPPRQARVLIRCGTPDAI